MPRSPQKKKPSRAATLADVGKAAGVSAMAASAVLNGARTSSRISADTRGRILEAAAELRYRPNAAARALIRRRMSTLGVAAVLDRGELNYYFLEVFNGVLEAAARHGQNTTVFTLHDWERDAQRISGFCDGRIDGLLLIAPLLGPGAASFLPAHTPLVSIHANHALPGVIDLESDEEAGTQALVRQLINLGHRRILHLAGPEGLVGSMHRLAGYRRALEEAGIPFDPDLVRVTGYATPEGREAMRAWLDEHKGRPLPTAVFCANDGVAFGCMEALSSAGLRVPDDISVAGFDDTLSARASVPQLSTVRQPLRQMGARAVELLLDLARTGPRGIGDVPSSPVIFPTEPVLRASVAPPRAVLSA